MPHMTVWQTAEFREKSENDSRKAAVWPPGRLFLCVKKKLEKSRKKSNQLFSKQRPRSNARRWLVEPILTVLGLFHCCLFYQCSFFERKIEFWRKKMKKKFRKILGPGTNQIMTNWEKEGAHALSPSLSGVIFLQNRNKRNKVYFCLFFFWHAAIFRGTANWIREKIREKLGLFLSLKLPLFGRHSRLKILGLSDWNKGSLIRAIQVQKVSFLFSF